MRTDALIDRIRKHLADDVEELEPGEVRATKEATETCLRLVACLMPYLEWAAPGETIKIAAFSPGDGGTQLTLQDVSTKRRLTCDVHAHGLDVTITKLDGTETIKSQFTMKELESSLRLAEWVTEDDEKKNGN